MTSKARRSLLISTGLLAASLLAGCASTRPAATPKTTFILSRHAEKASDDPKDPTLSEAGFARAQRLATMLASVRMTAVYATKYRRTQLTAAPSATSHHLDIQTYDAALPAPEFARQLRDSHPAGTVLVIGHSNTIPALAAALCGCTVAPMRDDEFDRVIEIQVARDGRVRVEQRSDRTPVAPRTMTSP